MSEAKIRLPPKLTPLFTLPRGEVQYRGAHGGRGSGKSFSFAKMAAVFGFVEPLRVLCTRDLQSSIKESFHAELKSAISTVPWLEDHYDVGMDYLRGRNGTEFIFRGLRHNSTAIKSLAKIDLTIVEEAEDIAESSWLDLEATIFRQPKSELWPIWNPSLDGSPVDNRFRKNCPNNARIVELNWEDNPFFPAGLDILRRREQERLDPQTYAHIWEGQYLQNSNAQVLHGKVRVEEFDAYIEKDGARVVRPGWNGPYCGADWGFSQDPTAAVRCWVHDGALCVDYEAGQVGLELDHTADFLKNHIPDIERYQLRSDSARPETISYLRRHGLPRCESVKKWPGSVEDGISHLRSYREIVIHPRCRELIRETRLYSYKVDRMSGDVLPAIVDAHNHYIDALRYALNPMIQQRNYSFSGLQVAGL
jgi:phage terminase large subunit